MVSAKRLVLIVLLAAVGGGAYYYFSYAPAQVGTSAKAEGKGEKGKGGPRSDRVEPVAMATVEQKSVPVRIEGIGNVEAYTFVQIKSRVDGQIIAVNFKEGQEVKKGEVLFRIDPRPYEAALHAAEASLARDKASADRALAQEVRQKELLDKQFISADGYSQFRTNAQTALAAIKSSEAAVENAQVQVDFTTIRSPITGYVGKVQLQLGNIARAADVNPIAIINQVHPIYVTFAVPEQRLSEIRGHMKSGLLSVEAVPSDSKGKPVGGKLVFIDNAVDQTTGTIKLRAQFENLDNALWPGQFANVSVKLNDDTAALVIPGRAIQTGPNGQFVFVVKPDMTAEIRPVKVARNEGDLAIVGQGLQKDERVVIEGQLRLTQGTKVSSANGRAAKSDDVTSKEKPSKPDA